MRNYWNKLLIISLLFGTSITTYAQQSSENSPFSRYGLGNVWSTDYSQVLGMGGINSAYKSIMNLNVSNPASLAFLGTTSFETGIYSRYDRYSSSNESADIFTGNLTHLALGFPLKNPINRVTEGDKSPFNWGMSLGLMPYSTVGYDIVVSDSLENVGNINYEYLGSGGLYQLFWGNGVRYKGFAAGFHAGYLFGQTSNERVASFPDLENPFSNILTSERNYRGFIWKAGLQYEMVLDGEDDVAVSTRVSKTRLTLGATANSNIEVDVTSREIAKRFASFYGLDTVSTSNDIRTNATLPAEWSFGAVLSKDLKWLVGLNFSNRLWSNYTNEAQPDILSNTWRIAIGGEIIPNAQSYNKYTQRMTYRFGAFYGTDPRVINDEQLTHYAVTMGLGFPLEAAKKGTIGLANIALEVGQMGAKNVIQDTYVKLNIGFSLNDNTWFYKQRFN